MKKLLLLLLCVPLIGLGQEKITMEELNSLEEGVYFQGELFSCINCELWSNGKIKEECTFIDGKRNGLSVQYYKQFPFSHTQGGNPKGGYKKGSYKNGVRHGLFAWYDEDHLLYMERMYNGDTGEEEYEKTFHPNGQLMFHAFCNPIDGDPDNYQIIECWEENGNKIDCQLLEEQLKQ